MARKIKMAAGILNVRLHPHSRDTYLGFIKDLFAAKGTAQVFGDRYGMISSIDLRREGEGIVEGLLTTFLRVDTDGDWFDLVELKEADTADVAQVNIPPHIAPNSVAYYFEFDANNHRLYYQSYTKGHTITPNSARRLIQGLAANLEVTAKYNMAKVSIIQQKRGLEEIFSLRRIDEIEITLLRPNPDIFADDFEAQIEAHLEQTHSRSIVIKYDAEPGQSIVATPRLRAVGEAALENGHVDVKGRNEVGAVTLSTENFPVELQTKYDPEVTREGAAFRNMISEQKATE